MNIDSELIYAAGVLMAVALGIYFFERERKTKTEESPTPPQRLIFHGNYFIEHTPGDEEPWSIWRLSDLEYMFSLSTEENAIKLMAALEQRPEIAGARGGQMKREPS